MYGNVVTNKQIRDLIRSNCLDISDFEDENLKEAAYTLNPGKTMTIGDDGEVENITPLTKRRTYTIAPNAYVVVEARQKIAIRVPGIIGTFITASTNIEHGLLVIAGQIDSRYGMRSEALRFGVKNLLDVPNEITLSTRLVHMQLIDLRGSASDNGPRPRQAEAIWDKRIPPEERERILPNYDAADE